MGNKLFKLFLICILSFHLSCKINNSGNDDKPVEVITLTGGYQIGEEAYAFTEKDSNGDEFKLNWWKGSVILLCFSTWWCGPCRAEAPKLVKLYQKYKDQGFKIVQCIYQDEDSNPADINDIKRWIETFNLNFPVVNDPDRSTVNAYHFNSIPFNILIDKNFIIQYREAGYDEEEVEAKIEELLK